MGFEESAMAAAPRPNWLRGLPCQNCAGPLPPTIFVKAFRSSSRLSAKSLITIFAILLTSFCDIPIRQARV
jgi:hypothetical protein